MDYTTISLAEVRAELVAIAADAQSTFGPLDAARLNWQADASRWSVAQCLDHLVTANGLMAAKADAALDETRARTLWQRLPLLPGLFGRMLIRSQSPDATRRFKAPAAAKPASSGIDAAIVTRFLDQQRTLIARLDAVSARDLTATIMTSPFLGAITYSVLDGWRLLATHERRHIEQAKRVMATAGFPAA